MGQNCKIGWIHEKCPKCNNGLIRIGRDGVVFNTAICIGCLNWHNVNRKYVLRKISEVRNPR